MLIKLLTDFLMTVPVQWDRGARSDIQLSRYFSSPMAHMQHRAPHAELEMKAVPAARMQELALG
jgi:hypothetical protein